MSTQIREAKESKPNGTLAKRSYILYYHYRYSKPQELGFEIAGDLKAATERAQRHCLVMNYRFIKVRPFIVDLDDRERRRNEETFRDDIE